jgi:hypothetical protein
MTLTWLLQEFVSAEPRFLASSPERHSTPLLFIRGLLPFCGRVHFLVHSWSNKCYLGFQSAVLVAIRAA